MRYSELIEKKLDEDKIYEMIVRHNSDELEGSAIVAYRDSIWIIPVDLDGDELDNVVNSIDTHTKNDSDVDVETVYDLISDLNDSRPDILAGYITDNMISFSDYNGGHSPQSSPLIKKVIKQLNLDGVTKSAFVVDDNIDIHFHKDKLKGDLKGPFFHGTTTRYLRDIMKKGLVPKPENSRWDDEPGNYDFAYDDRVFLTNMFDVAAFHANRGKNNDGTVPVIIQFKDVPDHSLITLDYDMARMYSDDETLDKENYSHRATEHPFNKKRREKNHERHKKTNINKMTGIFAYKGRVPAKMIDAIYFPSGLDDNNIYTKSDSFKITSASEVIKALEIIDLLGYYDPYYDPHEFEDEDDLEYED